MIAAVNVRDTFLFQKLGKIVHDRSRVSSHSKNGRCLDRNNLIESFKEGPVIIIKKR
jgi:hypothetical protein